MSDLLKQHLLARNNEIYTAILGQPHRTSGRERFYLASYRDEADPSLRVNFDKGLWRDDPKGLGHDVFGLIAKLGGLDTKRDFPQILKMAAESIGVDIESPQYAGYQTSRPDTPEDLFASHYGLRWDDFAKHGCFIEDIWFGDIEAKTPAVCYPAITAEGKATKKHKSVQRYFGNPLAPCDWSTPKSKRLISKTKGDGDGLFPPQGIAGEGDLVFTGGEEKALVLLASGFRAVSTLTGEKLSKSMLELFAKNPDKSFRVTIAFDADDTGKENARKAADLLSAEGYRVYICQWHPDAVKGRDVCDIYRESGAEGVRRWVDSAKGFGLDAEQPAQQESTSAAPVHPQSAPESEKVVIADLVRNPTHLAQVLKYCQPEHFINPKCRSIMRAIIALSDNWQPADIGGIANQLTQHNELNGIGGIAVLRKLASLEYPPNAVVEHAKIVAEWYAKRETISAIRNLSSIPEGYNNSRYAEHVTDVVARVEYLRDLGKDEPEPLDDVVENNLPKFPVEVLPKWLGDYCTAVHKAVEVPIDAGCFHALGVLSTAIGGKYAVQMGSYREALQFFGICIMKSGERKTSAIKPFLKVLTDYDKRAMAEHRRGTYRSEWKLRTLEKKLAAIEKECEKSGVLEPPPEAIELRELIEALESELKPPMPTNTKNATLEAISLIMSANNGRASIIADEGGILKILGGSYSSNGSSPNTDVLLDGYNNSTLMDSRVNRKGVNIDRACLSISLNFQPERIPDLIGIKSAQGIGLIARFCYAMPKPMVGFRKCTDDVVIDDYYTVGYEKCMARLFDLPMGETPTYLQLDREATEEARRLHYEIEPMLVPNQGELDCIADWAAKYRGLIIRMAGFLHLADAADQNWDGDLKNDLQWKKIDAETLRRAEKLGQYFLAHAKHFYISNGLDSRGAPSKAQKIIQWCKKRGTTHFSMRDMMRGLRKSLSKEEMFAAIDLLIEKSHIEEIPPSAGRKQPLYRLVTATAETETAAPSSL